MRRALHVSLGVRALSCRAAVGACCDVWLECGVGVDIPPVNGGRDYRNKEELRYKADVRPHPRVA